MIAALLGAVIFTWSVVAKNERSRQQAAFEADRLHRAACTDLWLRLEGSRRWVSRDPDVAFALALVSPTIVEVCAPAAAPRTKYLHEASLAGDATALAQELDLMLRQMPLIKSDLP